MDEPVWADEPDTQRELADWHALAVGILAVDSQDKVLRANPAAISMLTGCSDPLPATTLTDLLDPVDAEPLTRCLDAARRSGTPTDLRVPSLDGQRELLLRMAATDTEVVVSVEDMSDAARSDPMREAMVQVLDLFGGFVGIADDRANVLHLNRRACEVLGVAPGDVEGMRLTDMLHAETFTLYYEEIRHILTERGRWSGVVRLAAPSAPNEMWGTVLGGVGDDGHTIEWLAAVTQPDLENEETVELAHRANHDHLTGLPNRSLFLDRLRLALLRRDRAHHPVTVAFLDLDRFKSVNDTAGHQVGDELLRRVAERLGDLMRPTDMVARWGGDEFVILCEDAGNEVDLAARLVLGLADHPFEFGDHRFTLGATVGTAVSPPGQCSAEDLVAAADAAMYRSKRAGDSFDQ